MGNIPGEVLTEAGELFSEAQKIAQHRGELEFTEQFWSAWDAVYPELNRDRPDGWATEATARGVTYVLRLSMLYALFDDAEKIDAEHLHAALALWDYCEHSARWLFSSHELEKQRETAGGLASFIREGGRDGRTRTEISRDYFRRNKTAVEITDELTPLVHDGVVFEIKDETGARPITRYVHRDLRINEFTNYAGQGTDQSSYAYECTNSDGPDIIRKFVDGTNSEMPSDQHDSLNSLIRSPEKKTDTNSEAPGGITDSTPGMTDRVRQTLAKVRESARPASCPCGRPAPIDTEAGLCQWCTIAASKAGQQ
jgi:hypothetical protein